MAIHDYLEKVSSLCISQENLWLSSGLASEEINGTNVVYCKDHPPTHIVKLLRIAGPYCQTGTIYIAPNSFTDHDRILHQGNTIQVRFFEPNSVLYIGKNANLFKCTFNLGIDGTNNEYAILSQEDEYIPPVIFLANGVVATETRFNAATNAFISVGQCSAIAKDVIIRAHDDHGIIDLESSKILNIPRPVILRGYNWLCERSQVMKGSIIGYGSVVAAESLANKSYPSSSIIGGVPAKVIKSGVTWQSKPYTYDSQHRAVYHTYWNTVASQRFEE